MDLTEDTRLEQICRRKDETGAMGTALLSLRSALTDVISDIKEQSALLYRTSESLNSSAAETAGTVQNVERAVSEIAVGAASQAEETQKASDDILIIGNMVQNTSSEVSSLRSIAQSIRVSSDMADSTLHELHSVNQRAIDSINIIYKQTHTTNESALKIREATSLISAIADETSLLSLNASIEAARAGEAGRGFAVVASQIQKLAEQSNESASQIDSIIHDLLEDSQKAVETMESVREIMMQQNENVTQTGSAFTQVQGGIASSAANVDTIANRTDQLNSARVNIVDVVQNLTSIAEQNAANTQETSALRSNKHHPRELRIIVFFFYRKSRGISSIEEKEVPVPLHFMGNRHLCCVRRISYCSCAFTVSLIILPVLLHIPACPAMQTYCVYSFPHQAG